VVDYSIHDDGLVPYLIHGDVDSNDTLFNGGSLVTHLLSDLIDSSIDVHVSLSPVGDWSLIVIK
jgi:hypothetical protein